MATYMRRQHGVHLAHPDWPCVKISATGVVPLELCRRDWGARGNRRDAVG